MTAPTRPPRTPADDPRATGPMIAPDGQRVVDQRGEVADERAMIEREAAWTSRIAHEEGARTPSVRFWEAGTGRIGALLALLAGVLTFAFRVWPIGVPQGHGSLGGFWFVGVSAVAVLYLLGFFQADRRWKAARSVLLGGAALHVVIGLASGALVDVQGAAPGALAMLFDLGPAVLALVAAFLLRPAPSQVEYWR